MTQAERPSRPSSSKDVQISSEPDENAPASIEAEPAAPNTETISPNNAQTPSEFEQHELAPAPAPALVDPQSPKLGSDITRVASVADTGPAPAPAPASTLPQSPRPDSEITRVTSAAETGHDGKLIRAPTRKTSNASILDAGPSTNEKKKKAQRPSKPNRQPRRPFLLANQWAFELLSCSIALLCLVAIILVLAIHRDSPLPQWPKMISINSLVAIFTAIMKAAILLPVAEGISQAKWLWFRREPRRLIEFEQFDSASRGPWGSLMLVTKARRHYLASIGAMITIIALAIDPFSQQIIRYYTCVRVVPHAVARIPRTNNYTNQGIMTRPLNAELDAPMAGAIYMGLLASPANEAAILPVECHTGNCTFPTDRGASFSTLGMCTSVTDISDTILRNITYPGYWIQDWNNKSECAVGLFDPNGTTPYQMLFTRKTVAKNPAFDDLVTFDILTLNVAADCDMSQTKNCEKYPFAARHSLFPCIKTYRSSVTNSQINETLVSTLPLRKTNASAIIIVDSENLTWSLATNETLRDGKWQTCENASSPSNASPVAVSLNGTLPIVRDSAEPVMWYPDDCVWQLDYVSALALHQFASWMFDWSPLLATTENTIGTQGPGWLKTYYRNGTVDFNWATQYMEGLASAITARMRQSGESPPSQYALGEVLSLETCIRVEWAWLSLPIALVLITIAFLVATIVSCIKTGTWFGAWKSSALAVFFTGFDDDARAKVENIRLRSDMEDKAKTMFLQMTRNDAGVRFVARATA